MLPMKNRTSCHFWQIELRVVMETTKRASVRRRVLVPYDVTVMTSSFVLNRHYEIVWMVAMATLPRHPPVLRWGLFDVADRLLQLCLKAFNWFSFSQLTRFISNILYLHSARLRVPLGHPRGPRSRVLILRSTVHQTATVFTFQTEWVRSPSHCPSFASHLHLPLCQTTLNKPTTRKE